MVALAKNVNNVRIPYTLVLEDVLSRRSDEPGKYPYKGCKENILAYSKDWNNTVAPLDFDVMFKVMREDESTFVDFSEDKINVENLDENTDRSTIVGKYCCQIFFRYYRQHGGCMATSLNSLQMLDDGEDGKSTMAERDSEEKEDDILDLINSIRKTTYDLLALSLYYEFDFFSIIRAYKDWWTKIGKINGDIGFSLGDIKFDTAPEFYKKPIMINKDGKFVKEIEHSKELKNKYTGSYPTVNKLLKQECFCGIQDGSTFYNTYNPNHYLKKLIRLCDLANIDLDVFSCDKYIEKFKTLNYTLNNVEKIEQMPIIMKMLETIRTFDNKVDTEEADMKLKKLYIQKIGHANVTLKDKIHMINESTPMIIPLDNLDDTKKQMSQKECIMRNGNFCILGTNGICCSIRNWDETTLKCLEIEFNYDSVAYRNLYNDICNNNKESLDE